MVNENTEIIMSDGSTKKISHVSIGDLVTSISANMDHEEMLKITNIYTGSEDTMLLLTTCNGIGTVMTEDQPVLTADNWVRAENLKAGDRVWTNGAYDDVKTIEAVNEHFTVYDLELETEKGYYANQLGVGSINLNFKMQETSRRNKEDVNNSAEVEKMLEEFRNFCSESF